MMLFGDAKTKGRFLNVRRFNFKMQLRLQI